MTNLSRNPARHGRFSDHVLRRASLALGAAVLFLAGGCTVHDANNKPEPGWWPNFILHDSTVAPTGGRVNVYVDPKGYGKQFTQGVNPQVSAEQAGASTDAMAAAASVAPVWFDPGQFYNAAAWYHPQPYSQINGAAQAPAAYPQQNTPTLYPDRGQAALEAGSATLYPPTGSFQTSPQHDVTTIPRGATGSRGYRGQ